VSPASLTLTRDQWGAYAGTITLSNTTSGPVSWSVSLPPDLHVGGGWNSPASGMLAPGQSYQLSIYSMQHGNGDGNGAAGRGPRTETITVHPGNIQVSVTIPGR
jgi:hypothetical protein